MQFNTNLTITTTTPANQKVVADELQRLVEEGLIEAVDIRWTRIDREEGEDSVRP